jgi:thiol-disulfide isomerase/thioredoxin
MTNSELTDMITRRSVLKSGAIAFGSMVLPRSNFVMAAALNYGIKGQIAPELQVDYWIDENGDPANFKLSDHEGKWVFLKCFQSWCPGCHSHGFPALKQISDALAGNPKIAFAGIQTVFEGHYTNTIDKVREIQLQYDLRMPMGHDPGPESGSPKTMVNYRTGGTPWMILINPDREVIFNGFGINAEKAIAFLVSQTS